MATSRLMLAAQYPCPRGQPPALFVRGEWRYLGHYYFDYYNQDGQAGYARFNARAGASSRHLELARLVRNILGFKHIVHSSLSPQSLLYMPRLLRLLGTTLTVKLYLLPSGPLVWPGFFS